MKTLESLLLQPMFRALGWTLLHFIWQGALVAAIFAALNILLRRCSANVRYLAACSVMLLMLILPLSTFYVIRSSQADQPARFAQTLSEGQAANTFAAAQKSSRLPRAEVKRPGEFKAEELLPAEATPEQSWAEDSLTTLLPWFVLAWLTGATILSLRFLGGWKTAQRLKSRRVKAAAPEWQAVVTRLGKRLGISRAVRLCESALVEVPTVLGWLRPVILVPASVLTGLGVSQVEALIAHELAHVRRHDYLVNLFQTAVETLLFYHPAVWWVSRQIRAEREHCCDDTAVAACGDVLVYASTLAALEQLRGRSAEQFALAASGGSLLKRIRRLIETPKPSTLSHSPWLAGFVIIIAVLGLFAGAKSAAPSGEATANEASRLAPAATTERQVAVTFYSLPYIGSNLDELPEVEGVTRKMLKTLTSNRIPAVGFVGGRSLYKEGQQELRTSPLKIWLDEGFELGTKTFSHIWFYKTPLAEYEADAVRGEAVTLPLVKERGQTLRYFFYPYLNTGPDAETKAAFEKFLRERGYTFAPITIDNMDWLFAKVYEDAVKRGDTETMRRVARDYVPYMERMFEFYEKLSVDVLGYEVPQVLMLTASRLNTDYLPDLVQMLKRRGYSFISLEAALKDKAFQQPDTYTGPVGISWLQRWAITKGMGFRKEPPLPVFMQQFDKRAASASDFKTE